MKLALLAGNRFSPWHLNVYAQLGPEFSATAFRAESEIQRHFSRRGADTLPFPVEPVYFDTQSGPAHCRLWNTFCERYRGRAPEILPFHDRLAGFDAILSWELFTGWTAQALEAKNRLGIPVHLMVWDNIVFNNEDTPAKRETKARALREADSFLVHTQRSREMLLLEGAREDRIFLLNPGVDLAAFSPGPSDRAALGLEPDDFVLLFVGWLLPRKGIDFLLLAFRRLLDSVPQGGGGRLRLLVSGSGPGESRVRALIERLGLKEHCVFCPARPYAEMPALFRASDVFVLPSIATETWQEQFGMSLIEAMACGTPCISTLSGAIPEILGDSGLLCQPNDFMALHAALSELLGNEDYRQEIAAMGHVRAKAEFGLDRFALALRQHLLEKAYSAK